MLHNAASWSALRAINVTCRGTGDPKEILKSINPREAQLLDAAAGAHVRFRLGGSSWPPLIFYKIFTHRPVTGIRWLPMKSHTVLTCLSIVQLGDTDPLAAESTRAPLSRGKHYPETSSVLIYTLERVRN